MSPTLHSGQNVLVNRLAYVFAKPQIRDIVALRDPRDKKILVKRITKEISGRYFVEGDNKDYSTDSRVFGMIGRSAILGNIIL